MSHRERNLKLRWILPLLLIAAGPPAVRAGQDTWTPFGPSDGALQSLIASSRGELYVTTSFITTEIWQRPLAAGTWRWRDNGLGRPAVTALAVHPKNPNLLWAVSGTELQSVYLSTDAGASWVRLFTGDVNFRVVHLWVAPTRRSVILLAETGGTVPRRLLRSADTGVSWQEVPGVLGPVAAPPDEPNVIYAAATGGGVVRSTDGGATFRPTGPLPVPTGDELRALHATYSRQPIVFASFRNGGLFRSVDSGRRWRRAGFVNGGPPVLASEPKDPRTIYAADGSGLYASHRGGESGSFHPLAQFFPILVLPEPTALVAAPGGPYFLAGPDLYHYVPGQGGTFGSVAKTGIESFGVAELRFHPADPSILALRPYSCIPNGCSVRTLLSTDGGATFQRLGAPLSPRAFADVFDLAFDPLSTQRWLMAMGVGAVLTDERGTGVVLSAGVAAVEIGAGGVLLAGGLNGVQVSEDDGRTWQTTLGNTLPATPEHPAGGTRRGVDLLVNPYAPDRVIARAQESTSGNPRDVGTSVLYRSSDIGRTWTLLDGADGVIDVEFVPGAPSSLYLLVSTVGGHELRRSDDDGATSHLVHVFPTSEDVGDVATDPSAPQDLYAASILGVLRSRDGGATWESTPGDFGPWGTYRRWVRHVQVHPTERGHLFAVPVDGGLFENQLSD
ncbi:MAG: hypothetical protein QOF89_1336 [Acidobacteriota bacterium]|jgi:photosystem II stability/assembly factor-like uncharacterized protein|nr:hypothetical protein [Acidobacteriota bacterium]